MSLLHLEETPIPPNSVFVEHRYLPDSGSGWNWHHVPRDHIYRKPNEFNFKVAAALTYGADETRRILENLKRWNVKAKSSQNSSYDSSDEQQIDSWTLEASKIPDAQNV